MLTIAGGIILAFVILANWERIRKVLPGVLGLVGGALAFVAAAFALMGWLDRSPDARAPIVLLLLAGMFGLAVLGLRALVRWENSQDK